MRIVAVSTLQKFWLRHPQAKSPLQTWVRRVRQESWKGPHDVKTMFRSADFVGHRIVFNVGGNDYRLVVDPWYEGETLYVKFVGTHAEYDGIDVEDVSHD